MDNYIQGKILSEWIIQKFPDLTHAANVGVGKVIAANVEELYTLINCLAQAEFSRVHSVAQRTKLQFDRSGYLVVELHDLILRDHFTQFAFVTADYHYPLHFDKRKKRLHLGFP